MFRIARAFGSVWLTQSMLAKPAHDQRWLTAAAQGALACRFRGRFRGVRSLVAIGSGGRVGCFYGDSGGCTNPLRGRGARGTVEVDGRTSRLG
jgi:hypothetical protein